MAIDPNSNVPIYEQIVDSISSAIAAGIYLPGEKLPSLRKMALGLVVNPNTVQRAYETIERDGLIYSRQGLGFIVTDQGVGLARDRSRLAVRSALARAVAAARAAGLDEKAIRELFEKSVKELQHTRESAK